MASTGKIEVPAPLIDAINGLPDAVFLVMDDGVIIAANSSADKMFGFSHSQLIGSQVDELMPAGARDYHRKVRTGAASDIRPRQFTSGRTFECERRGGEVFQADIMLSPTKIDGVSMTWAIVRDLDAPSEINAGRQQALGTLDAIGHMAASAFDLTNDFAKVAARLKELIPHNLIGVTLLCEDDPEMIEIAFLSGDDHPIFREGERTPLSNSATAWVVQKRARVSFTKAKTEFAPAAILTGFEQGYTEFCGAPLFDDDSVIGMLMLSTRDARGFSEFHKNLIDRLAEHLSVGIVNQRMRGKLQAHAQQSEAVGEIGKIISTSPDLDSALSAASESIRQLVPYDRLSISSIDLDEGVTTEMFLAGELLPGFDKQTHRLPDDTAESFRGMFATGEPILFDKGMIAAAVESKPSFIPYRDAGYRWALIVPLLITQRPVGMMVFGSKDSKGYSDDQIAIANRIGEQLAGPVANAFQLTRATDEIRIGSILAEIGAVVGATFDLQQGEHELGPLIRELVDNNSITLSSVTQDGMNLNVLYMDYVGISVEEGWGVGSVHSWKGTTAERVLQTREPVLVNAESWDDFRVSFPGAAPGRPNDDPKSVINVPLIANDEIFGFMTLRSVKRNAYSETDVAMSVRIGAELTGSIALSELRRRDADLASERTVLASIGGLLGSAVELADVWPEFADLLSSLLPFSHVSLTGIDTKAGQARILNDSWTGNEMPLGRKPGEIFPLSGTIAESLAATDQGIIIAMEDPEKLAQEFPGTFPSPPPLPLPRSLIGVPLAWGGETVAALFLHGLESGMYTPRDLRLAERVASQIAGPVAGGLLRARDTALAAERETLARIGSVMGSALDLSEAWPDFTDLSAKIVEFDRVVLVSIDDDARSATVMHDSMAGGEVSNLRSTGQSYELEGTVAGNIAETGISLITNRDNPDQLDAQFSGITRQGFELPFKTNLGVPLTWGGKVVACLFFSTDEFSTYKNADLLVGERIGTQIAGPVAGSLLRERESMVTAERETLAEIGSLLSAAQDFDATFDDVSKLAKRLIDFDAMSLIRFDEGSQTLSVMNFNADESWNDSYTHTHPHLPADGSLAGKAISDRQGFIYSFSDAGQLENDFPTTARANEEIPARTTIVSPLQWGDKIVAVLWFSRIGETPFLDTELALGERIATQFAGPVAGNLLRTRDAELMAERGVLAGIGELTMSAPDIGSVFEEFAGRVQQLVSFDRISIHEIDHQKGLVRRVHSLRSGTLERDLVEFPLPGTMAERVASTLRGLLSNFASLEEIQSEFPGAPTEGESQRAPSTIMVPLVWQGEVAITLSIGRGGKKLFGERDLELLERVAAQISGPIAGALLRERDEALVREREMLTGIGELMGGAPDIGSVFEEFTDQVRQLVSFDAMSFLEMDRERQTVRREHAFHDKTVEHLYKKGIMEFPLPGTMAERVIDTRQGILHFSRSMEETQREFPGAPTSERSPSSRSSIMVPLVWGDEVVVAFWLARDGEQFFTEHDLALAERIAAQIAGPVAGSLLRKREAEITNERALLAEIAMLLSSGTRVEDVFDEVAILTRGLVQFDALVVYQIIPEKDELVVLGQWHGEKWDSSYSAVSGPLLMSGTLVGEAVHLRKGIARSMVDPAEFAREFPGTPDASLRTPPRSSIAAPIIWGDEIVAVLWMSRMGERSYTAVEIATVIRIAAQISDPVAGFLVSQQEAELVDERRRREAAELKAGVLAEFNETKSNFVSAMSHELRTPLTSIVAFADILSRQGEVDLKERQLQQVKVIQRNARRLEGMINELLDLSRMESGRFEIVRATFDFTSMIAESLESSELQFEAMSQTVNFEIVSEVLPINADRGRLLQVVNNLLNNASKYSPNDTEIEIVVTEDEGVLSVEVRDRGPGILGDKPQELFEMFHRADDELTRSIPGTGIGLHVAKRIIEEHGGEITIASREGGGATARFWIPTGVEAVV